MQNTDSNKNKVKDNKQDGQFHSKSIKHDPQAEGARAKFGLKSTHVEQD